MIEPCSLKETELVPSVKCYDMPCEVGPRIPWQVRNEYTMQNLPGKEALLGEGKGVR